MIRPENRNILWATILVDELGRAGVRHAVIAPGSRSTPLAIAFSRQDAITIHSVIDERAAAFFGLGIGKASGIPAVVVCTSGTAAANFFPAIVEASMSNVPLIVMTADRPHELRDSGANQTIDQVKLYGGYVRWFVDVAPPHANPEDKTLRYLRTTVDRAVAYSQGANGGPVHLNVPFEKPLEPVVVEGDVPDRVWEGIGAQGRAFNEYDQYRHRRFTQVYGDTFNLGPDAAYAILSEEIRRSPRGLIICGPSQEYLADAVRLGELIGYPILAESLSGIRFSNAVNGSRSVLGGYETFLRGIVAKELVPDLILHFGDMPVGAALLDYLEQLTETRQVLISSSGQWTDSIHCISELIAGSPFEIVSRLISLLEEKPTTIDPTWNQGLVGLERLTWEVIQDLGEHECIEGSILQDTISALPDSTFDNRSKLIVANSNPIRHLDQFVPPQKKWVWVYGNRGASGIDGTVATAIGIATDGFRETAPTVLVIGDLALYHDLNSLHLVRRFNIPLVIVCINNDGGGIFHRLPIANYDPPFHDLFVTPHGLTFEHAAKMFDIPYTLAQMGDNFRAAFKAALESGEPALIEVPSDAAKFEEQRKRLIETVAQRIKEAGILEKFKASQGS